MAIAKKNTTELVEIRPLEKYSTLPSLKPVIDAIDELEREMKDA